MTITNHALTGAVVALVVKEPLLALPLALLSHFVIDIIPHFDARPTHPSWVMPIVKADAALATLLTVLILSLLSFSVPLWLIFSCMILGVLPDAISGWRYFRLNKDMDAVFNGPMSRFSRLHYDMQLSETLQGGIIELFWAAIMLVIIINSSL